MHLIAVVGEQIFSHDNVDNTFNYQNKSFKKLIEFNEKQLVKGKFLL